MENAFPFNKSSLHGAYDGWQNTSEFPADELRDTLIDNIAARDRTIVTWGVQCGNLWNKGYSYGIPRFQKRAISKEVLNCFHNI